MKALFAIVIFAAIFVGPVAFLAASANYKRAKRHGQFRKEYERAIFRTILFFMTVLFAGLVLLGLSDMGSRGGFKQFVEVVFALLLLGFLYLISLAFGYCAVVGARWGFHKGLFVYLFSTLLCAVTGPIGLALLALLGLQKSSSSTSGESSSSVPDRLPHRGVFQRLFSMFGGRS